MATVLSTAGRNAACDAVTALLAGTNLLIKTAGAVTLSTIAFASPAFGAAAAGVASLASAPRTDASIANTGTASTYDMGGGVITGPISDLSPSTTSFVAGGTASLNTCTITMPAS